MRKVIPSVLLFGINPENKYSCHFQKNNSYYMPHYTIYSVGEKTISELYRAPFNRMVLSMKNLKFKIAYYSCLFVCTSTTIGFISLCLIKYSLNDDVSQVTFQEFHTSEESLYPSITICLTSIFYKEKFKYYGEGINISTYADFMNGEYWDDRMLKVDYDRVTLNFSNYLMGIGMWTPDWRFRQGEKYFLYDHRKVVKGNSTKTNKSIDNVDGWTPIFYDSYKGIDGKCFTIDIPYIPSQKVWTFGAVFNSAIFPGGIRPSYYKFGVKAHYPGQLIDSKMNKYVWKETNLNTSKYVAMRFKIQKLEVMKHRKTRNYNCNMKMEENDKMRIRNMFEDIGCKPPWYKENEFVPVCKNKEKIKAFLKLNPTRYVPPCQSIYKILETYHEFEIIEDFKQEWLNEVYSLFEVMLEFQDGTYMEIRQIRAYPIQALVGDIGGYLGLFLGFALLQIPEVSFKIYVWIDGMISKRKPNISDINENEDIERAHDQ